MADVPISELLPHLTVPVDEGDIILDAVILMRVASPNSDEDGRPGLHIATTPDLDWMIQIGMLHAALSICSYAQED